MFAAVLTDRFFSEHTDYPAIADDFPDLPDRTGSALTLHHAKRDQPGAAGHEDCQRYAFVSELSRRASVFVERHQRADAGQPELHWAAPNSGCGRYLSILLRWSFPAESVDREFQHSRRSEAISVR